MKVWQIAAGEVGRYYEELFIEHDVMFMGPGEHGKFDDQLYQKKVELKQLTNHKKNQIGSFVNAPVSGDIVLLRKGYYIDSIGVVPDEGYHWSKSLDDVYGWDLQHTRRIIWQEDLRTDLCKIQEKGKNPLFGDRKQIPTFTAVEDQKILEPLTKLFDKVKTRELKSFKFTTPEPLSMEMFGEELFARGLSNESVDKVVNSILRQRRLGKWYSKNCEDKIRPTEQEVVGDMVLPLMLALGWSEQLLAVEWNKVDLAGFSETPTEREKCILICEAKRLSHGLQSAFGQAQGYFEKLGLKNCKKILVTDGMKLYVYEMRNREWSDTPCGYFNVEKIRTNHIAPKNTNAIDTLLALTPGRIANDMPR